MKTQSPATVYLKDYSPPDFLITHSDLEIELDFESTRVEAIHKVSGRNPDADRIVLDCERLEILSILIDGDQLEPGRYQQSDDQLEIYGIPDEFELTITNTCNPSENTELSGLYESGDMLCTQCEAEGYRRITPAIDRPDNLATYRVKLIADKQQFPVLLSNGNLESQGDIDSNSHFCEWVDPFPKPTYLFAIVAGHLESLEDHFTTRNGRDVTLRFYARGDDIKKCGYAMESLKNAMLWDEQVYGREYDLDLFNVVAVNDFNMGAMENKSLNIFNTKYVLADPNMATDLDFQNVEGVIGHEYFHNWSGNRVTCRDWFQLSLKEGFTVFRDQEFSADMGSRGVKRIDDVSILRSHQFREDASPMAHAIRPDSYQEINNFYTVTVYNKGAEVVRMLHTLYGPVDFRRATDWYFEEYDGQAVTTDDFVSAFESVVGRDLRQFKNWYSQAGTPRVVVESYYDAATQRLKLKLIQDCPPTPEKQSKNPFVIPIRTALFSNDGQKLTFDGKQTEKILVLEQNEQVFEFSDVESEPIPSLLRQFSAPIELEHRLDDHQLGVLLEFDDDPFNRWEAAQSLYLNDILTQTRRIQRGEKFRNNPGLVTKVESILDSDFGDMAYVAKLLSLPAYGYVSELLSPIDPQAIHSSLKELKIAIAESLRQELLDTYQKCHKISTGQAESSEIAARTLRDTCLGYLCALDSEQSRELCMAQLENARCMSDAASAMSLIARSARTDKQDILEIFYEKWKNEPLVVDKWLLAQSTAPLDSALQTVKSLVEHAGFDHRNPNKAFALILGFTHGNPRQFHALDGSGYDFLREWVTRLDGLNPQISSRLVSALNGWRKYRPDLAEKMQETLVKISELENLSADVGEIVEKNLA